jgi:hypothetical protein
MAAAADVWGEVCGVLSPWPMELFHGEEKSRIKEYFTKSWGYDPSFVELAISYVGKDMSKFGIRTLSRSLAELADDHRDCDYTSMTNRIAAFSPRNEGMFEPAHPADCIGPNNPTSIRHRPSLSPTHTNRINQVMTTAATTQTANTRNPQPATQLQHTPRCNAIPRSSSLASTKLLPFRP